MTREDAIKILNKYDLNFCDIDGNPIPPQDLSEAFHMAIEALQQESIKFYYVESIDDYWIGQRHDNFYYAKWNSKLGFVWSASRYLPWGEHIVDENTLWKEHTYPSEPKEIPFVEWIIGFTKKYFQQEPKWIPVTESLPEEGLTVLIFAEGGEIEFGQREKDKWEWLAESIADYWTEAEEVIAWQPLPEPYEETEQ